MAAAEEKLKSAGDNKKSPKTPRKGESLKIKKEKVKKVEPKRDLEKERQELKEQRRKEKEVITVYFCFSQGRQD